MNLTITIDDHDAEQLCEGQFLANNWAGDLAPIFGPRFHVHRSRGCPNPEAVSLDLPYCYGIGSHYPNVILLRAFLDVSGADYQIVTDENFDSPTCAEWYVITDWAAPCMLRGEKK